MDGSSPGAVSRCLLPGAGDHPRSSPNSTIEFLRASSFDGERGRECELPSSDAGISRVLVVVHGIGARCGSLSRTSRRLATINVFAPVLKKTMGSRMRTRFQNAYSAGLGASSLPVRAYSHQKEAMCEGKRRERDDKAPVGAVAGVDAVMVLRVHCKPGLLRLPCAGVRLVVRLGDGEARAYGCAYTFTENRHPHSQAGPDP